VVTGFGAVKGVLKATPFRRLWYCTGLSSLGDWLGLLATTALATQLATGYQAQNYALGAVLVVRLIPSAILGPLAGAFADRFDRRLTMVITDLLRFLLFLSIPIAHSLTVLYVATFLIECVGLFWNPAKDASVPNLVRKDQIEAANQLSLITTYGLTPVVAAASFSLLALISKALASRFSFFSTNQVGLALYFNATTFLVGGLTVLFIREISGSRGQGTSEKQPSLWAMLREGAHFVRTTGLLRGLILGILGAFAAGGAVIGAGKTYVRSLGGGDAAYGMLFGTVFVGLGLGMALGPRVAREVSRRRLFGLSIVFAGGCLGLTAVMPHVVLAMLTVVGVGFGAGVGYLAGLTLLGSEIENEMRGRIFAFIQSMVRVVMILALAAVPVLVGTIGQRKLAGIGTVDGTRIVLFAAGLLAILAGVIAYRQMDDGGRVPVLADLMTSLRRDSSGRRRLHSGGVLIAFEGGEGAGKSTQIELLAESVRITGTTVVVTHEPGATTLGRQIRRLLLETKGPISPRSEALLFAADRAHHVATVIRPALDRGDVVVTDRFIDSSLAYQGAGRTLSSDEVKRMSRWATEDLIPDLTILLDIAPELGLARARGRQDGTAEPDRLERETLDFHQRVREAFRKLAESDPKRYLVLDATLPVERQAATIRAAVLAMLSLRPVSEWVDECTGEESGGH